VITAQQTIKRSLDMETQITRIIPEPLLSPLGATRGRISITLRVAGRVAA